MKTEFSGRVLSSWAVSTAIALFLATGPGNLDVPILAQSRPAAGQRVTEAVIEGELEVIVQDADTGSRVLYFLLAGDRRIPLRFQADPDLQTGARVRVRGRWEKDGALIVTSIERLPDAR